MKYVIYLQGEDINDATFFYVNTIERAILQNGDECEKTRHIDAVRPEDTVVVIQGKAFFRVWARNPRQKIIMWFQGIVPEEADMQFKGRPSRLPRIWVWRFLENLALKKAVFLFFVSEAMVEHFRRQYGYAKKNYFVMPCFNLPLDRNSFYVEGKYRSPGFVYAGGLNAWQCFESALELFKAVEERIPDAGLTILTGEQNEARRLVAKHGVKNAEVKYVTPSEIGQELARHKYGLMLREDHIVNRVATPTKMNSYLAAGVIPVYTDVIGDFKIRLKGLHYAIRLDNPDDVPGNAERIVRFEEKHIDPDAIRKEYEKIFADYYDQEKYIERIRKII